MKILLLQYHECYHFLNLGVNYIFYTLSLAISFWNSLSCSIILHYLTHHSGSFLQVAVCSIYVVWVFLYFTTMWYALSLVLFSSRIWTSCLRNWCYVVSLKTIIIPKHRSCVFFNILWINESIDAWINAIEYVVDMKHLTIRHAVSIDVYSSSLSALVNCPRTCYHKQISSLWILIRRIMMCSIVTSDSNYGCLLNS